MPDPIDPVTLEVIRNRIEGIANEIQVAVIKSSHSIVVKEAFDASASIFDLHGEQVAQAAATPIHLGVTIPAVRRLLQAFPPAEMAAGDAYVLNDPFGPGPSHLPDIVVAVPVVVDDEAIALVTVLSHHQDIGGRSPGGQPPDATEIYQEGLRIPPLKLLDRGEPNATLTAILRSNVRTPDAVLGDLNGQIAGCRLGCRRLQELVQKYGRTLVTASMRQILDQSEAMAREIIRSIPDGSYSFVDYLDNDGIRLDRKIRIDVKVTVSGSHLTVDMSGSDRQVAGPINAVAGATMSGIYYLLKAIGGPTVPNNGGYYRPVETVLPPGLVVSAEAPAAVSSYALVVVRTADCLLGALGRAMPGRLPAASHGHPLALRLAATDEATKTPVISPVVTTGGMGARPTKDGVDAITIGPGNAGNVPLEVLEAEFPLLFEFYRLRCDSGGPGRFRGGLGLEQAFTVRDGTIAASQRLERHLLAPWGVAGGGEGRRSGSTLERFDGSTDELPSTGTFSLSSGDRFEFWTTGGGGFGDPLARDRKLVAEDVENGKVSPERAAKDYGFVGVQRV
jgi:N-methylhydantoinase B